MLIPRSAAPQAGQWYKNPTVITVVVALALLIGMVKACSCACRSGQELSPELVEDKKGLPVWCPHCKAVYLVPARRADRVPGDDPPFMKALKVPCPTCKKPDGQQTIPCFHCDTPVPLATDRDTAATPCPKCGKNPYGPGGILPPHTALPPGPPVPKPR